MSRRLGDPNVVFAIAAHKACRERAEEIVAEIRRYPGTPVLTGKLKSDYRVIDLHGGGVEIVNDDPYWRYQEFGTINMPKNPHVRPSIEIVRARRSR